MEQDEGDAEEKARRTLKRMKRSRDSKLGILSFKVIHAHQVFDHLDLLDMSTVTATSLDHPGLVWIHPTPYLQATAQAGSFPGLLGPITSVPKILVRSDSRPEFIVTVGMFRYIESLTIPMFSSTIQPIADHCQA